MHPLTGDLSLFKDAELEEYQRQAQELWNDSCTAPRKAQE
jgi:hypothetical protein